MLDDQFIVFGAGVNFVAGLLYVAAVLRGRARPNRVTWLVWASAAWIAFVGQFTQGVVLPAVLTGVVALVPTLILLASFVSTGNTWTFTTLDWICLAGAGVGIGVLMVAFGDAAILVGIAVHALGAIPTVVKAYRDPSSEAHIAFTAGMVNAACTLGTLDQFTIATSAFAFYFLTLCAVLSVLIVLVPRLRGWASRLRPAAAAVPSGAPPGTSATTPRPAPSGDEPAVAAAVQAFAAALAHDYASVDPEDPARRAACLAAYSGPGPGGWASDPEGLDRVQQVVDTVLPGAVTPTARPGTCTVEVRLRLTTYLRDVDASAMTAAMTAAGENQLPGIPAAGPTPASPPGWRALRPRWHLLHAEVTTTGGVMAVRPDSVRTTAFDAIALLDAARTTAPIELHAYRPTPVPRTGPKALLAPAQRAAPTGPLRPDAALAEMDS